MTGAERCSCDISSMASTAVLVKKRKALGLDKTRGRVLYDMAMRRELDAV